MRTVFYELADGLKTTSYEVALASGQNFVTKVESMNELRKPMSENRKKALAKYFGKKR